MAQYVDGFVLPLQESKLSEYRKLARLASEVWREHGALQYVECIGDDVPVGKSTSFPRSVKLKEGEVVIFAWIVYKSRKDRDRINALAMQDPRFEGMDMANVPFDPKRMFFGGFSKIVDA